MNLLLTPLRQCIIKINCWDCKCIWIPKRKDYLLPVGSLGQHRHNVSLTCPPVTSLLSLLVRLYLLNVSIATSDLVSLLFSLQVIVTDCFIESNMVSTVSKTWSDCSIKLIILSTLKNMYEFKNNHIVRTVLLQN